MSDRVCGAEVELQRGVLAALRATPLDLPQAEPGEVADPLRCVLQAGHGGEHHGLARGLPLRYPGEVWARWVSGRQPSALMLLPDCLARDPDDRDEPCILFNGHAGAHSWLLTDPDEDDLRGGLDLDAGTDSPLPPECSTYHCTVERDGRPRCCRYHD